MTEPYASDNVFARILRGELPATKVFEDEVALALMDIMPRGEGHTLVIPKVAARGLLDMPPDALGPFMLRVQKIAAAVSRGMQADGLTVQQFNETAGGQVVFHLHFHLLPRWDGVALKPPGTMGDRERIEANAAKIRAAL
jgi:histidine triad (HIT) family protein